MTVAALGLMATGAAAASDRTWTDSFGYWSQAGNWSPAGLPGAADRVFVGQAPGGAEDVVNMDVNATIGELDILGRAQLDTEGWWLIVNGPARIDGSGTGGFDDYNACLNVLNGAGPVDFRADSVFVGSEGTFTKTGSPVVTIEGPLTIAAQGRLLGDGTVNIDGPLSNSGEIQAFGDDMTLNIGGSLDLDGSGTDVEFIINDEYTDVTVNAPSITDAYNGSMFVGGASSLTMNVGGAWSVGSGGQLRGCWWQSTGRIATIAGDALTMAGDLKLLGQDNIFRIQPPVTISTTATVGFLEQGTNLIEFNNDATIDGGYFEISEGNRIEFGDTTVVNDGTFILAEDATLAFDGATTVHAGDFATYSDYAADGAVLFNGSTTWDGTVFILGIARQMGNAVVNSASTINARVFDMDGAGANWTINNNLTINANAIDEVTLANAFNTQMTIGPALMARLTINHGGSVQWRMDGQMNIIGDPALFTTRVAGSPMRVGGALSLSGGRANIAANTTLAAGSTTTIPAGATLRLSGAVVVDDAATLSGAGMLRTYSTGSLRLDNGASLGSVRVQNEGTFEVGEFAAAAAAGGFEGFAGSSFRVTIAGLVAGTQHDRLVVAPGNAAVGGQLHIDHRAADGSVFVPAIGDEFTILTAAGGVSGAFVANPTSCAAGRTFHWTVLYGGVSVTLRLDEISECCPPDITGDGQIDLTDLAILLTNFGMASGATQPMGDIDFDGDVDLTDLAMLLTQFGSACS